MATPVGVFPDPNRRIVRSPVNPLDKSTIVSILPKEIHEVKHTIQPGKFDIPAGSYEKPAILIVGPSSWWRDIDEEQPLLEIPHSSVQIAESIVVDYCNGILGYKSGVAGPGLFYIPGEIPHSDLKVKYKEALDKAQARQRTWYMDLIKMADALWARSNGNPLAISDDMRMAARELGHKERDWMKDHQMIEMVRCEACGGLKSSEYPVCPTCKAIDQNHPKAKNIKFAQ